MAWGRLHDRAAGDAKLLALSDAAFRMWACGLIYCQNNLTDGFIPEHAIETFGVRAKDKGKVADELCKPQVVGRAALWARTEGGFAVHDYLDWNDSRDTILQAREDARNRMARRRRSPGGELSTEQPGERSGERSGEQVPEHPTEQHANPVVRGSDRSEGQRSENLNRGALRRHGDGAAGPGANPRAHLRHVWCDDTYTRCVPEAVHDKLANMLAIKHHGDRGAAGRALLAWYPTALAGLPADAPIGDEFKFWQRQFDASFVTSAPAAKPAPGGSSAVPSAAETAARYLAD